MKKIKDLLKKLPKRKNQRKQQKNPSLSPNLLKASSSPYNSSYYGSSSYFKFLIFGIQALFLIVILANFVQNRRLDRSELKFNEVEQKLSAKKSIFKDVLRLNTKVNLYRSVQAQRTAFGDRLDEVYASFVPGMEIYKYNFDGSTATLEIRTQEAITAALLFSRLLERESIAEIVLKSAELSTDGTYDIKFDVEFK